MVRLVHVAPEDQALPFLGVRSGDREHAVDAAAGLHAQAEQVVERLRQIDRDLPPHAVAHDREGVCEGIPELLAEQGRAAGRLDAERVAQPVVLRHFGIPGQQFVPLVRRRRHDEAVHRVLVGFQADVLETLRHAVTGNRPPFFPVRRVDDLLHARQQHRVEMMTDLDEDVLAPFAVDPIEVEDGMTGRAGAREEIERDGARAATRRPQAVFDEADRLGEIEVLFSEQILQRLRAEVRGCVPRVVPPRSRQGFGVHVYLEVDADFAAVSIPANPVVRRLARNAIRTAVPAFFYLFTVFDPNRPYGDLILRRLLEDVVFLSVRIPSHRRHAKRVLRIDVNRVEHRRPILPPVARSVSNQIVPRVSSARLVHEGVACNLALRLGERSRNGVAVAVEDCVLVGRRELFRRFTSGGVRPHDDDPQFLLEQILRPHPQQGDFFVVDRRAQNSVAGHAAASQRQSTAHQRQP